LFDSSCRLNGLLAFIHPIIPDLALQKWRVGHASASMMCHSIKLAAAFLHVSCLWSRGYRLIFTKAAFYLEVIA